MNYMKFKHFKGENCKTCCDNNIQFHCIKMGTSKNFFNKISGKL